jgi:putative SOS response-associated peptidase YedK
MAGIFSPDRRFAILTREAAPMLAEIHARMPVIVPYELMGAWLRETSDVFDEAVEGLQFAPAVIKSGGSAQMSLF